MLARSDAVAALAEESFDVLVVGGGRSGLPRPRSMNGSPGSAAAAAERARIFAKYCSGRRPKSGGAGRAIGAD